jgi:hypothetical protein
MKTGVCYSVEEFIEVFKEYSKTTESERRTKLLEQRDYYHVVNKFPDWFQDSLDSFKMQVYDMASPTKPLKTTDTFKIQAGYPHEVSLEGKTRLARYGIEQDRNVKRDYYTIPKLTAQTFLNQVREVNVLAFTTPKGSQFMRDVIMVDTYTNPSLIIFYVVNRKARIVASWTVKRDENEKFVPKISKFEEWKYRQP